MIQELGLVIGLNALALLLVVFLIGVPRRVRIRIERENSVNRKSGEAKMMKLGVALALALGIVVLVLSTWAKGDSLPIPNRGGSCPFGYTSSGGYCVGTQGASDAIPLPANGNCPFGWLRSGNGCLRSGSR